MRHVADLAFRVAMAERCPTCIIVPNDLQEMSAQEPPHEDGTVHSGVGYARPRTVPTPQDLRRAAADVLNAGAKVAMLVGAGALHATQEVIEELIKLAKDRPGKLNYASFGIGSIAHIAGEMLKQATQTQIVHIPYKSSPLAVQETIAGQAHLVFGGISYRPKLVLCAGFAGALSHDLNVGDLVLADSIADTHDHVWPATWPGDLPPGPWRPHWRWV